MPDWHNARSFFRSLQLNDRALFSEFSLDKVSGLHRVQLVAFLQALAAVRVGHQVGEVAHGFSFRGQLGAKLLLVLARVCRGIINEELILKFEN
ncbi:MAG: hypothetical protein ACI87L_000755 [Litorivivens sp.]